MKTPADNTFDYIIIGAGSAGNVLACRLTEDADVRVLLLEAGGPDYRFDYRTQMPAALAYPLQGRRYNWAFATDPEPNMNNREMDCGRGKGLGGSSLINGMCYIRGNAMDLEHWASKPGLSDWRYANCLPYYKKAETRDTGANDYHGEDGPVMVASSPLDDHPLKRAFVEAAVQAGHAETDDLNGFRQEGFGPMDRTVTPFGRRSSTARGYLGLAKPRANLTIVKHALTDKILVENNRAYGVLYLHHGQQYTARAEREVLLCAGSIGSPTILQRSGIGDPDWLTPLGIQVVHSLPAVGKNLQDHLETYVQFECTKPITLYPATKWYNKPAIGAKWLFLGKGIGASNQSEAGGFLRTDEEELWPNIQYHFLPIAISYNGKSEFEAHGFQAHVGPMRSQSRGRVRLRSTNPLDDPSILFNYMSEQRDWYEFRRAIHLTREIFHQSAMAPYVKREVAPGPDVQSDSQIDEFIRSKAETAYHPCGTCRMGEGEDTVVDGQGRMHGLSGLRIVDASLMPQVITGNLNATTIMLAEKIADYIRNKTPLAPDSTPFYRAKSSATLSE